MLRPTKGRRVVLAAAALALVGGLAVGCGGADEPGTTPTPTVTVTATTSRPPTTSEPSPEPGLARAKVVLVREFPDGQRALVAYDFSTGKSRRLVDLSRDEDPTVSPDGTQVVLVRANGPWRDPRDHEWLAKSGSHLVLIDLVDGGETVLTDIPSGQKVSSPEWNRSDGWIYFLGPVGRSATGLVRLNPDTMQREPVPHGRGVTRFVLEPDGTHALISVADVWCRTVQLPLDKCQTPREWRLDLGTGSFRRHPVQAFEADLAWTPTGSRLAAIQGGGGAGLYTTNQPSSWFGPRNLLYAAVWDLPSSITHFTGVAWEPDGSHVVLGAREGRIRRLSPVFDRWYVSLIDRRTAERTDITPPGAADTSFDVWWPEG
ncbi:MAG: hypothetical protein WBC76_07565 [Actinomycetes bacterium]|jgi:hypothetical protein